MQKQLEEARQLKAAADKQAATLQEQLDAAMQQIVTVANRVSTANADAQGQNEEIYELQDQLSNKTVQLTTETRALEASRCVIGAVAKGTPPVRKGGTAVCLRSSSSPPELIIFFWQRASMPLYFVAHPAEGAQARHRCQYQTCQSSRLASMALQACSCLPVARSSKLSHE